MFLLYAYRTRIFQFYQFLIKTNAAKPRTTSTKCNRNEVDMGYTYMVTAKTIRYDDNVVFHIYIVTLGWMRCESHNVACCNSLPSFTHGEFLKGGATNNATIQHHPYIRKRIYPLPYTQNSTYDQHRYLVSERNLHKMLYMRSICGANIWVTWWRREEGDVVEVQIQRRIMQLRQNICKCISYKKSFNRINTF